MDPTIVLLSKIGMNIAYIYLVGIMLLAHELGHALFALICGERIKSITLGLIKLKQFEVGGTEVNIGLLPVCGLILLEKDIEDIHPYRHSFIASGGLLVSLGLGIALLYLSSGSHMVCLLLTTMFSAFDEWWFWMLTLMHESIIDVTHIGVCLGLVSFYIAVFNAIPILPLDGGMVCLPLYLKLVRKPIHYTALWGFLFGQIIQGVVGYALFQLAKVI